MSTKHTPGPWRVHSFSLTEHVIPEVWGMSGDEYSDHIKRAEDAHLIAAAPELQEALTACVEALAFLRSKGVYVWPNHPENPEAKGRAALAKAAP